MPEYTTADIRNLAVVGHGEVAKRLSSRLCWHMQGPFRSRVRLREVPRSLILNLKKKGISIPCSPLSRVTTATANTSTLSIPRVIRTSWAAHWLCCPRSRRRWWLSTPAPCANHNQTCHGCSQPRGFAHDCVNRIDADEVDCEGILAQIQEAFGSECCHSTCQPVVPAVLRIVFFAGHVCIHGFFRCGVCAHRNGGSGCRSRRKPDGTVSRAG